MPFYEYECARCGQQTEAMQKVSDPPLRKCPACGKSALRKLMSAPVFRLKGSGWYETDFKKDGKKRLADSGDGFRELPHDFRPLRIGKVEAIGRPDRQAARARDVARGFRDRILRLALGADEQDTAALGDGVAHRLKRAMQHRHGLGEIDDMNVVAGAEDVIVHLRIPAVGLMAKVHASFQKLTHAVVGQRHGLLRLFLGGRVSPNLATRFEGKSLDRATGWPFWPVSACEMQGLYRRCSAGASRTGAKILKNRRFWAWIARKQRYWTAAASFKLSNRAARRI